MSYLSSFKHDIFISYSHIDNRPLTPGQRGWIDSFHETLEVRLAQVLGADAAVWRDPELPGNEHFNESLPARASNAAIFVSIVSPRYVQSEWCLKELRVFCSSAQKSGGLRIGDRSRLFKVLKFPVDEPDAVPELTSTIGYEFFARDRQGIPRELDPDMGDEERRGFRRKVDDIAYHVRELLKEFRDGASLVRQVERPVGRVVYLAETTWDLRDEREVVRRELRQRGFRILPEAPLPFSPDYRKLVRDHLRESELSVHMVGTDYGAVPERETSSIVAIQYEQAGQRVGVNGVMRVVWIPDGHSPAEPRQQEFLHALRTDPAAHRATEILEGAGIEDLKTTIHDILERRPSIRESRAPDAAAQAEPVVYLVCDPRDLEAALHLRDYLVAHAVEAVLPLMEGDEPEIRSDHQQNLVACDAALVYWGGASEAWVRSQLRELLKAPGYGRADAIPTQGLYVAAPETAAKARFLTRQVMMLHERTTFQADVEPFLDRLRASSR
jgi:hypothetical protein